MVLSNLESLLLLLLLFPLYWPHRSLLRARQERGSLSHWDSRGSSAGSTPCLPSHLVTASHSCVRQATSQGQTQRQELPSFYLVVIGKILGSISPSSLLSSLYLGTLCFLEAQDLWPGTTGLRFTFLGVFLASTLSRSILAHMLLCGVCRSLEGTGEGSLYPFVCLSRSTCSLWV